MNNSKRETILAALLTSPTVLDASRACGVPRRTITRWLSRPDFKAEYDAARGQIVQNAWAGLNERLGEAISVVGELMQEGPPYVRLQAARTVLEFALRAEEVHNITPRLEALEAAQNGFDWPVKGGFR